MNKIVREIHADVKRGMAALKRRQTDQAAVFFTEALNRTEQLEDDRSRRGELSVLSDVLEQCGFPDMALQAAEEAVDLDETLDLPSLMAQDLLAFGNAHKNLNNTAEAEGSSRGH